MLIKDAILVVEAEYRSGSSITAKYAKKEGKTIYSIPNSIYSTTSIGTNKLIQEGAILATKPMQIIEEVKQIRKIKNITHVNNKIDEIKQISNKEKENLNHVMPDEYLPIYRVLSDEPLHINEIAMKLDIAIKDINPIITMMELEEYIFQPQTNYFVRKDDDIT